MAINMETAFRQLASAMEVFRTQLSQIKFDGFDSPFKTGKRVYSRGMPKQNPIDNVASGPAKR